MLSQLLEDVEGRELAPRRRGGAGCWRQGNEWLGKPVVWVSSHSPARVALDGSIL